MLWIEKRPYSLTCHSVILWIVCECEIKGASIIRRIGTGFYRVIKTQVNRIGENDQCNLEVGVMIEVSYFRNRIYLTSHLIIFGLIHCEDLNLSLSSFNTICYSPLIFLIWFLQWFLVVRPLISKLQMIYFALTRFGILIGLLNFMWSPVRTSPSCCTNQTQNCKHQPCALCLRKYLHLRATKSIGCSFFGRWLVVPPIE